MCDVLGCWAVICFGFEMSVCSHLKMNTYFVCLEMRMRFFFCNLNNVKDFQNVLTCA